MDGVSQFLFEVETDLGGDLEGHRGEKKTLLIIIYSEISQNYWVFPH